MVWHVIWQSAILLGIFALPWAFPKTRAILLSVLWTPRRASSQHVEHMHLSPNGKEK
jgi:hypothetical protein